ncbi:hypothetical protein [Streptomyces sp. TS71-3]|uniref:hypothetical protein n=1 Tax=Streptomyces sp. TS71-3 TaxID=2733862 RepID=UPI001B1756DB|nr:hypothetical protein [Streptomyces sp. TS71-3]GHJ38606.1 hypothetical protein Sm713_42150 [Streptomyces sp. TS71-3]
MTTPTPAPAPDRDGPHRPAESDRAAQGTPGTERARAGAARTAQHPAPRAACTADSTGDLAFHVTHPPAAPDGGPLHVLLRRRGKDPAEELRLPLVPLADGRPGAVLALAHPLAEGRWDAYLEDPGAGGPPLRLAPGVHDLRALVDRVPDPAGDPVAVRIPYTTKQGDLAVRSWRRLPHAEAGELHIAGGTLTVHGVLHAVAPTEHAHAELLRRGSGTVLRAPIAVDGNGFRCTVAYRVLADAAPPGVWDLWLRPAGQEGPRVRIARLLDDIADKKHIFAFPAVRVAGGRVEAGPYYTLDNDLAVRVEPVADEDGAGSG